MVTDDPTSDPVASGFRRLFQPLVIGAITVENRLLSAPHGTRLSESRDLRYLRERARGGAGLFGLQSANGIWEFGVGTSPSDRSGEWDHRPPSPITAAGIAHYDDIAIPWLRRRADVIHAEGKPCISQVYHPGAARHSLGVDPVVAPSAVRDSYEARAPYVLRDEDIEGLVITFAHGIRRIREAGVDGAEIHGAHGYLVNQFLSPRFNQREDRWGGTPERRASFVLAILSTARKMVGEDFPIGIRVGVESLGSEDDAERTQELVTICRILAPHVTYLSISGGNYVGFGAGVQTAYVGPAGSGTAVNAPVAAAVRAAVDVPVFVTGRINDPSLAESLLAEGVADMVGMVRALIADPDLPNKARSGRANEIRMCLGVSECHATGSRLVPVNCAVNAAAGREDELRIDPADTTRTVVVVGAGPSGMEAARVAAMRGHRVWLADANRRLGGTPAVLALDPNRRNLLDQAAYFEVQFRRLGVELMLGNRVDADELASFGPDVVVVATGGLPVLPDVPGADTQSTVQALDVLRGVETSDRVVVVGGLENHLGPPTVAEFLADRGSQVVLVSEHFDFASGVEQATRLPLYHRLRSKGVEIHLLHRLAGVDGSNIRVVDTSTGEERVIADASLVMASGTVADDTLAQQLRGKVPEVHLVGDALAPRRIVHATLDGLRIARRL